MLSADKECRIAELSPEISPPPFLPDVCTGSVCYRRLVTTMVMSAKTEFWISVIGLSGRENGPGKSCLCDRFMFPDRPPSFGHTSIISQQDFHGPIVNTDQFLYWGRTRRTVDGKMVEFNIIEQTEFLDDVTFSPFNARDPYMKRATSTTINSSRKVQYLSPEQLQDPKSQKAQRFASRKLHIDGFLCVYDVSKVNDRQAGTQYKFVFELLDLIDVPVVLVATKCDKGRSRHFEEMMYLAKIQKVPIVETSSLENVNVAQAFFSLVRIFNRQVIVSKKHIQYFNPKELAKVRKNKKGRKTEKMEKKAKKQNTKEKNEVIEDIKEYKSQRNGSVTSKNGSEMSNDWVSAEVMVRSNPEFPTPRDSPLTDSLLSDPPYEPPYEHINGDEESSSPPGGTVALYENCVKEFSSADSRTFHSQDSSKFSSHDNSVKGFRSDSAGSRSSRSTKAQSQDSAGSRSHDTESRDSQHSKSSSLQSKTSSDEYIPVPRAPYDPSDNYENVRYHQRPSSASQQTACPSPTSHSSDSERGFLTGIPDHMKSFQSQRPWEVSYYTNVVIEPPTPAQSDPGTSSGTRSTSSIDTDCQANINYGRQIALAKGPPPSLGSVGSNGLLEGDSSAVSTEHPPSIPPHVPTSAPPSTSTSASLPPPYANVFLSDEGQVSFLEDEKTEDELNSVDEDHDLPPYPEIMFTSDQGVTSVDLNRDLEEMNTLVGEISSLVWQNEPLPPPPSDYLTPTTIPDFEKTPTNEVASPNLFLDNTETDGNSFDYPINTVSEECYENCQLPELPPRQPALPPRGDNSQDSSTSSREIIVEQEIVPDSRPQLPHRIPSTNRDKLGPSVPPRDKAIQSRDSTLPSRDSTLPSRDSTLPSRDSTLSSRDSTLLSRDATLPSREVVLQSREVVLQSRDLSLPPRTIPLPRRDSLTQPRTSSSTTAICRGVGHSQTLPPHIQPRALGVLPPQRIPGPVPRHSISENGTGPPNLPPRIKVDSSPNMRNEPSSPHMPTRVPLPPSRSNTIPVYSAVEPQRGSFPRVIHQREFSPYVVPSAPRIDRWEEYTNSCVDKKSQTLKKKVKVKIPQR
ncbi:uncharacterized protein LOC134819654 isoform X3 [Bolinopsis microptera]|uniref:uncharacterized protein LOC134819654 isoform X3 n=2 Tax=Bolinopsis microptera TaxID=2820187 RepID=UPI00307AA2F0